MGNELNINIKVNSDGSATLQQVTGGLGGLRQEAGSTGTALTRFSADAQSTGDSVRRALEFAGITVGLGALAYKIKEFTGEVMGMGARTEMLRGAAYAIGQYYQVSGQAIDYYVGKLKEGGITEQNAFYATSKFLAGGLNLELIPALAAAAKNLAPLAPEGKTVNEAFKGLVTTISSGMPRGLKEFGVQMGNVLGDAGRSLKQLDNELSMTGPERAKATLDYVLAYAEKVKYVGEETANAYARQQAKVKLEAERAKEALFEVFKPFALAVTGEKIEAWSDFNRLLAENRVRLVAAAEGAATYVGQIADGVRSVLVFAGTHTELFVTLLELATFYKVVSWIAPYIVGTEAAAVANATLAASQTTAAATGALVATAQTGAGVSAAAATPPVLYLANAYGAVTGTATLAAPALAGAGAAAASSGTMATSAIAGWFGLAGAIKLAVIALAAYGAYKTFKEPGQLTGPTASGDPFADIAGGARDKDVPPRGPLPVPDQRQQHLELEAKERQRLANAAVQKAMDDAKATQPGGAGKGGKGGGAGGTDAAERSLENFIQRMKGETAKASGEAMSALDEWKAKSLKDLAEIAAKGQDITKGREALDDAYYSKSNKLSEDFYHLMAKESGDSYVEIDRQAQEWLNKYQGIKDKEGNIIDVAAKVQEIKASKESAEQIKNDQERLSRQKDYLDKMASYAPTLAAQLDLQRQILGVEDEQARKKLDLDLYTHKITLEEWQQLEAVRAQTAAYALQAQQRKEWETQGVAGGVRGWAHERGQEGESRGYNTGKDAIKSAESFISTGVGNLASGFISRTKPDFLKMAQEGATSFVQKLSQLGVQKIFDVGAKMISRLAGKGVEAAAGVGEESVSQMLKPVADELLQGTGNLLLSTPGLMEGGASMIEGGLGIIEGAVEDTIVATELSMAALDLSFAGLDLAFAATALETAAISLEIAAAVDSIPFFHEGAVVAHQGWLVAHKGLDLAADERRIVARVGEGVLQVPAMDKWARAGVGFDLLNDPERLPVLNRRRQAVAAAPGGGEGGGSQDNRQVHFHHISIGDIHAYDMTPQEAERFVERKLMPAIQKKMGNYAKNLMD